MKTYTINAINQLRDEEKRAIYQRIIPPELIEKFAIDPSYHDKQNHSLVNLRCAPGTSTVEMELYHRFGFPDPILFGQITDTIHGQIHILFYVLSDPFSPRFDIDCLPNGTPTHFGTQSRNIQAELSAFNFGLAPGQIRRGLHLLGSAIHSFENFVASLGHELYFAEPLYYHNAIIFERYGFAYQKGRKLMERIQDGFSENGDLHGKLDDSSPFRKASAANSIRLRSWAIHDNILEDTFTDVTMYKWIGKSAGINTSNHCPW
jgi:hypothetical protein